MQLMVMDAYTDTVNQKLIFFSKRTFELSLNITQNIQEFIDIVQNIGEEDQKAISDFTEWLKDKDTSVHLDEKKAILAFVLADTLPNDATISTVLLQIQRIGQSVQAQYALYLENFSYEKFIKKLNESKEKFVTRINDTIGKILSQFLSLPLFTAVPAALKSADHWVVYCAIFIYGIICVVALSNQRKLLKYIEQDIEQYAADNKLPEPLKDEWNQEKQRIIPLINKQLYLYRILFATAILCLIYAVWKLIPSINSMITFLTTLICG